MKKRIFIGLTAVVVAGYFSFPFFQHQWTLYRLQKLGVQLSSPSDVDPVFKKKNEAEKFIEAACAANSEVWALLLKTDFDIQTKNSEGKTVLHCAAENGKIDEVRRLLDRGADISARSDVRGKKRVIAMTPLQLAAASHRLDVVELLKSRGADINEASESGTPLMLALTFNYEQRTELPKSQQSKADLLNAYQRLIQMGADPTLLDSSGNSLLHFAMETHDRPLIQVLLDSGSFDLNQPNKQGETAFTIFVRSAGSVVSNDASYAITNDLDFIKLLITKGADVNARNVDGDSLILHTWFQSDLFDLLFENGANVFVAQTNGRSIWNEIKDQSTPIIIKFAEKLPSFRPPMMPNGKFGDGPLHVFARESRSDLLAYFLRRDVAVDDPNEAGNTALHLAVGAVPKDIATEYNISECVKLLLDSGANPNARSSSGETPIMKAPRSSLPIVKMLIAKGADINAIAINNGKEKHVLDYFSENKNLIGFAALIAAGAHKPPSEYRAP